MKEIKKLLRENKSAVLPDEGVKDNIKSQLGMPRENALAVPSGAAAVAARNKNKNIIIAALAALLAVIIALAIALPLAGRGSPLPGTGLIDEGGGDKLSQITTSDEFYAYGAASVGAVLSSRHSTGGNVQTAAFFTSLAAGTDERIELVNDYLALVESLLSEGDIKGTDIGGGQGYEFGMTVSYSDLLGEEVSYVMYYDKIFTGGETDGDGSESNYSIEGVLVAAGASYPVSGNYTEETEEGEAESELYFRAYTAENSYIEVVRQSESENEDGESEREYQYVYTIYQDGNLAERMRVEYESEEGELELLMTIERGGVTEVLTFVDQTEDGERVISVRGDIDGQAVEFRIYVRDGQYHYVFADGSQSDYDRFDKDDEDDEDDDDDRRGRSACAVCRVQVTESRV